MPEYTPQEYEEMARKARIKAYQQVRDYMIRSFGSPFPVEKQEQQPTRTQRIQRGRTY